MTYDGRGFLTAAVEPGPAPPPPGPPGSPIFSDGFETGDVCRWTVTVGATPPPTCPKPPQPFVEAVYSSDGVLHKLSRELAPEEIYYFHFYGRPVAQLEVSGTTRTWKWITVDHLGTPFQLTNSAGAELWSGGFEPFGRDWREGTTSSALAKNLLLRLPGQWEEQTWADASSGVGVFYNVARWYQLDIGRYARVDPLGARGDFHAFSYSSSNPTRFVDPTGEKSRLCCTPIGEGILKPWKHFFIHIHDSDGTDETHELIGMGNGRRPFGGPLGRTFVNDPFDTDALREGPIECGEWNETCGADECVELQANNYPRASVYRIFGPNSNSFAGTIARACGLKAPAIAGTWHTPGWNDAAAPPSPGATPTTCPLRR